MVRFLKWLVLLPVAIVVVLLAVANRESVNLSLDPFSPEPVFLYHFPLYGVIFAAVALGVVIGGVGAWLAQGPSRRQARENRREADRFAREAANLRASAVAESGDYSPRSGAQTALPAPR